MHTLAEIVGYLAIPVGVARFQFMARRHVLLGTAIMSALMAVHYGLAGAREACLITAIVTASNLMAALAETDLSPSVHLVLAGGAVAAAIAIAPPHNALTCLPILGFAVARCGEMVRSDMGVRGALLVRSLLWLAYAGSLWDIPAMSLEGLNLVSNAVGICRRLRRRGPWALRWA